MARKAKPAKGELEKAQVPASPPPPANTKGARIEFDHVFLPTKSFEAAWTWWTDVVGLEPESKWGTPEKAGQVKLGDGAIVVAQGQEGYYEELGYFSLVGRPQIYLRTKDLDGLHARLKSKGVTIVREPLTTHFGLRAMSVEGPDGMILVFVQAQ